MRVAHQLLGNHCRPGGVAPVSTRPVPTLPRCSVIVNSAKAVQVQDHSDLATGWRVDPEGRVAKDPNFNPRDLMGECQTWQACASLLDESASWFERNKSLSFHLLIRLSDLLGSPADSPATALTRNVTLPPPRPRKGEAAQKPAVSNDSVNLDPFAEMLERDATAAARKVVGQERAEAMKVARRVVALTVSNIDRMRGDNICKLMYMLCRLELLDLQAMKAIVVYIKSNAKAFLVAELYTCLAACTALSYKVPSAALQTILEQGHKGAKFVQPSDLNNVAYALHVQPRGAITHQHVNALIRTAKNALFEMSDTGLAYLVASVARQGYHPTSGFMITVMEALAPHLAAFKDPQALVALLYGLSTLRIELHEGVTSAVERVLVSWQGMAAMSPEQLGVLGTVLSAYSKQYTPSEALRTMYVAQVEQRMPEADDACAAGLLAGLAYMCKLAADTPAAQPATPAAPAAKSLSKALNARLAKLAAKRSSSPAGSPGSVSPAVVHDLLELVEPRLEAMSGLTLLQQAMAIHSIGHSPDADFADSFKQAVLSAPARCSSYAALIALLKAAQTETAALRVEEGLEELAAGVAAQAVALSQGPPKPAAAAAAGGSEGAAGGEAEQAQAQEGAVFEEDLRHYWPTQAELSQLREQLAGLSGVNVAELTLPEAKPEGMPVRRGGRLGAGSRGNAAVANRGWDDSGQGLSGWDAEPQGARNWYDPSVSEFGMGGDSWNTGNTGRRDSRRSGRDRWQQGSGGMSWADEGFDLSGAQGGWQDEGYGAQQGGGGGGGYHQDSWGGGGWGGEQPQQRARPQRRRPARPATQFNDTWFGGDDAAVAGDQAGSGWAGFGGQGDEHANAGDFVPRGFDRSIDLDDGMGDVWSQPDLPSSQAFSKPVRSKRVAQPHSNGFANLLDDYDYGFETPASAMMGEPGSGVGAGPQGVSDEWGAVQQEQVPAVEAPAADDVVKSTRGRRRRSSTPAAE